MSRKDIYPSEHLLDDIEEIANIKQTISLRDRSLTSANGLYVQSGSLPRYGTQFMAGGRFIARLVFVRKPDGSREIKKYQPGNWETKVSEVLELCRTLAQASGDQNDWPPEKRAAYELPVVIDGAMLERVSAANKQHYVELSRVWQVRGQPHQAEMLDAFINELKNEWPVEYAELRTNQKDARKTAELMQENVIKAYAAGYMRARGWISLEELVNANSYLGELLAAQLGITLKGAKSKGAAFGSSLLKISALGHVDAWHEAKEARKRETD